MSPKGTGTPAHIRALDKTLIGEGCWECRACNNARRNRSRTA